MSGRPKPEIDSSNSRAHHITTPPTNSNPPPPYPNQVIPIVSNCLPSPGPVATSASAEPRTRAPSYNGSISPNGAPDYSIEQARMLEEVEEASRSSEMKYRGLDQPTITALPNSILWIRLIRSRYLLIQSSDAVLTLWDLIVPVKSVATCSVDGTVDGAVIKDDNDACFTTIFLSTRSCITYQLRVDFPESQATTPRLTLSILFRGLSHVLDAAGPFVSLSHLEGRGPGAFIKNLQSGAVVELLRAPRTLSNPNSNEEQTSSPPIAHNGIIDIHILDDIVVVARNCNINLYNLSDAAETHLEDQEAGRISVIHPSGSLNYPGLDLPMYRGYLLRQSNPSLGIEPGALALLSVTFSGCYELVSQPLRSGVVTRISQSGTKRIKDLREAALGMFCVTMGASGRRFAVLSDRTLSVYYTSAGDSKPRAGFQESGGLMACWRIPGDLGDIPIALDFDEATGRCVAAMASGRLWVKETANFLSEPRAPGRVKVLPDFDVIGIPNPDPARWPVVMPYPREIPPLPSDPPKEVAPRWSDEVDEYFPYKNRSDCYGSIPWLFQEAVHIPVLWPGHCPASSEEYGAKAVLFTVEEARGYPIYEEVIEVRPLPGSDERNGFWHLVVDSGNWEFYRLKPMGGLDDIVAHLQHSGIGLLWESEEQWPVDEVKLDQLTEWTRRHHDEFGRYQRWFQPPKFQLKGNPPLTDLG